MAGGALYGRLGEEYLHCRRTEDRAEDKPEEQAEYQAEVVADHEGLRLISISHHPSSNAASIIERHAHLAWSGVM